MSIPRHITLGAITVLGTVAVCFVLVDRITHTAFPAPPAMTIARATPLAEPDTTGTVTQGAEAPETRPSRTLEGFDTERLNALMRGEALPARTAARRH